MAMVLVSDETLLTGADLEAAQAMARCVKCMALSAPEFEIQCLTNAQSANLQWVTCAQCKITDTPPHNI